MVRRIVDRLPRGIIDSSFLCFFGMSTQIYPRGGVPHAQYLDHALGAAHVPRQACTLAARSYNDIAHLRDIGAVEHPTGTRCVPSQSSAPISRRPIAHRTAEPLTFAAHRHLSLKYPVAE